MPNLSVLGHNQALKMSAPQRCLPHFPKMLFFQRPSFVFTYMLHVIPIYGKISHLSPPSFFLPPPFLYLLCLLLLGDNVFPLGNQVSGLAPNLRKVGFTNSSPSPLNAPISRTSVSGNFFFRQLTVLPTPVDYKRLFKGGVPIIKMEIA